MDIRDIKEEIPAEVPTLEKYISLQKELLTKYILVESLPPYPTQLDTKPGQILIKDFIGRVTEEMGEAMESYYGIVQKLELTPVLQSLHPDITNFNEEIADALHFFLEVLIYSNIYPEHLSKALGTKETPLDYLYSAKITTAEQLKCFTIVSNKEKTALLSGGRFFSATVLTMSEVWCWRTTYYLQLARNCLKNKPWKQTQMLTDTDTYLGNITEAFQSFILFTRFMGISREDLFELYFRKNRVNCFRIKSKY